MLKGMFDFFKSGNQGGLEEVNHMFIGVMIGKDLVRFLRKLDIKRENYVRR